MRLSVFILQNMEPILQEWENFARSIQPAHRSMDSTELRDHAKEMLEEIAARLAAVPHAGAQEMPGEREAGVGGDTAAEIHAVTRVESGFNIDQLVSEYRALRASVLELWIRENNSATGFELEDMRRFNEAIDLALADSVARYSMIMNQSQDVFLGVLGHDLRAPLQYLHLGAAYIMRSDGIDSKLIQLASRMYSSTSRLKNILDDLLDFTKSRIGNGMQITPSAMDLAAVAGQVADEFRFTYPNRVIKNEVSGDTAGKWDAARIGQVYQNLIANALQHGSREGMVSVVTRGSADEVRITVHNEGDPIPVSEQRNIFDPLRRYPKQDTVPGTERKNLGLGLYIVREIVTAHHGTIDVHSAENKGTTFTVRLPKRTIA